MNTFIPLIVFLGLGVAVLNFSIRNLPETERQWMMRLLLVAFCARLLAATLFDLFPGLRIFHEDADGYEINGILVATGWRGEGPPHILQGQNTGYIYGLGALYFVFGRYPVVAAYFNALLGTLLAALIYTLSKRMFHQLVARRAALLVSLMPSMILWSSLALKDTPVTFAIVIALSSSMALKEKITPSAVLGIVLPLLAIQTLRFYVSYFVAFAVVVAFLLDRGKGFITGIYKQIFLALTLVGLFFLLGWADSAGSQMEYFNLEYASNYRQGMASTARSGFDVDVDLSTPGAALAYLPVGVAHLLFAPFPWQMTSLRALLAAPETILWWCLVPATIRGTAFALRRRFAVAAPLLIFAVTLTLTYSIMQGNVGAAFRFRAQILVFLFIFCAAGLYQKKCKLAGISQEHILAGAGTAGSPAAA